MLSWIGLSHYDDNDDDDDVGEGELGWYIPSLDCRKGNLYYASAIL